MSRVDNWERRTDVPLLLLAAAFLVAYAWPILDPRIDRDLQSFLDVVSWTVWTAFAADFLIRLALAEERGRYALSHWFDVALILLALLRPLRLLRALALAKILHRSVVAGLAGRVTVYVIGTAIAAMSIRSPRCPRRGTSSTGLQPAHLR